ncbi:MAG: Rpn family recombination-promoting nuclease/putative transposase, partial [Lachnospiraceae bacterium]|nr:Rpn family recombination-promoting nuclease/putative transposase [Lachnospiraceae bacterium]
MNETEQKIDVQAMWEGLGISNDFLFGKVMQDAELCKGLLERIFPDMKIDHIEYPTLQKTINPDVDAKSVRLDVYVMDGEGTVYDIEMQMTDTKELPKRTRYYQAMMDLEMIDKGESYKKLKKSFVIFICPFDLFGKGRHIYTFRNYCREDKEILLGDDTAKIFLNAESRMEDINGDLWAFLDYVAGRKSEDSFVLKLEKAVDKAKQNRKWRHEYMTLLM